MNSKALVLSRVTCTVITSTAVHVPGSSANILMDKLIMYIGATCPSTDSLRAWTGTMTSSAEAMITDMTRNHVVLNSGIAFWVPRPTERNSKAKVVTRALIASAK